MRRQIIRLSVRQTAKVLAILYAAMGLLLVPIFVVMSVVTPQEAGGFGIGVALVFPVIYGVLGYVFVALGCLLYNVVARWVGGIEVEVRGDAEAASYV